MSRMLSKMNLISVVQQLPKEDIETIQGYVEMIEDENKKLKEVITNLSKDVDMWNAKYDDMFYENRMLKRQVEECQLQNFDLREDIMIQKQAIPNKLIKDKTFYDLYDMPTYEDLLTQQKEFIKWLEDYINLFDKKDIYEEGSCDILEEILNKYKEIIGDDALSEPIITQ